MAAELAAQQRRKFARPKAACKRYNIGLTTYYRWVKTRPGFPKPIKAGDGVTLVDLEATDAYFHSLGGVAA